MHHVESRSATPTALEVVLGPGAQQRTRLASALLLLREVVLRGLRGRRMVILLLLLQVRLPQIDHALLARRREPALEVLLMAEEHPLLLELHLLDVVRRRGRGKDGAAAVAVEPSATLSAAQLSMVRRPGSEANYDYVGKGNRKKTS